MHELRPPADARGRLGGALSQECCAAAAEIRVDYQLPCCCGSASKLLAHVYGHSGELAPDEAKGEAPARPLAHIRLLVLLLLLRRLGPVTLSRIHSFGSEPIQSDYAAQKPP